MFIYFSTYLIKFKALFWNGSVAPASASSDAYGLIYYFIQQKSYKDHTSEHPKQPHNAYRPDNKGRSR
jgi:hypothetical protein